MRALVALAVPSADAERAEGRWRALLATGPRRIRQLFKRRDLPS